jgi:hypothetical protein
MTDPTLDRIEHRLARIERQNRILIGLLCAMAVVASITRRTPPPMSSSLTRCAPSASRGSIRVAASLTIGTRMTRVDRIRRIPGRVIQDRASTLPELTNPHRFNALAAGASRFSSSPELMG